MVEYKMEYKEVLLQLLVWMCDMLVVIYVGGDAMYSLNAMLRLRGNTFE